MQHGCKKPKFVNMKYIISIILLTLCFSVKAQIYTSESGRQITHLKTDSSFLIPFRDTTFGRATVRPGALVCRPEDSLVYYYTGHKWNLLKQDSTGLTALINGKVDSLTLSSNILFYHVNGTATGLTLPIGTDSAFTRITAINDSTLRFYRFNGDSVEVSMSTATGGGGAFSGTASNGLSISFIDSSIQLGGALIQPTTINTSGANYLAITGVQAEETLNDYPLMVNSITGQIGYSTKIIQQRDSIIKYVTPKLHQDSLAAVQARLNLKAPLASPTFTGTPTAPTPSSLDSSTKLATTAFVDANYRTRADSVKLKLKAPLWGIYDTLTRKTDSLYMDVSSNTQDGYITSTNYTDWYRAKAIADSMAALTNNLQNVTNAGATTTNTIVSTASPSALNSTSEIAVLHTGHYGIYQTENYDHFTVGVRAQNTNSGINAAAGALYYNNNSYNLQYYVGSSGNTFVPDGVLFRSNAPNGIKYVTDGTHSPHIFSNSTTNGVDYMRIYNDSLIHKGIPAAANMTGKKVLVWDATGNFWTISKDSVGGSGGGSMVYPGAGIPLSTGSAWGTSITDNSANWNNAFTDRLKWDGGSTGLTAATGRTSLGATTVGSNLFTLTNPSAVTFLRINADNTVSTRSAAQMLADIGATGSQNLQSVLTTGSTLTTSNQVDLGGVNFLAIQSYAAGKKHGYWYMKDSSITYTIRSSAFSDLAGFSINGFDSSLALYGLKNSITQDRLVGQISGSSRAGYVTLGSGLSLSAGVLNTVTNLTAIGALSNASGVLRNNGTGTFSYDNTVLTANQSITITPTGDVTGSASGTTSLTPAFAIGTNKVLNTMLAQISTATFKGRTTAGTGNVEDLTATQATALLNNVVGDAGSGGTKGLVPAPASGDAAAGKFLKADGTWAAPPSAGSGLTFAQVAANSIMRIY